MAECLFIKADEVVKMLGVSQSEAYSVIEKRSAKPLPILLPCRRESKSYSDIIKSHFGETKSTYRDLTGCRRSSVTTKSVTPTLFTPPGSF